MVRRLLCSVLVAVPLVALLGGVGGGAGADAAGTGVRSSWMSGLTIHTAGVPNDHVPLPQSHAPQSYLLGGIDSGGWVILDDHGRFTRLYTWRNGGLRQFHRVEDAGGGKSFLLGPDGRSVVQLDAPTTRHTDVYTYRISGQQIRHHGFAGYKSLLAYDGHTVWVTNGQKTLAWRPGRSKARVIGPGGAAADPEHDLLFTVEDAIVGPTSLAAPSTPAWTLPTSTFFPKRVSPDGTLVAGSGSGRNNLQVRRVSDGSLVSEWRVHLDYSRPLVWDAGRSDRLVSVLRTRRGWAVERCDVGGPCVRSTSLVGAPISLPDQIVAPDLH